MPIINFLRGKLSIAMVSAIVTVASGPVYAESIAVSPTLGFDAVRFDANVFALRGNSATNKNSARIHRTLRLSRSKGCQSSISCVESYQLRWFQPL